MLSMCFFRVFLCFFCVFFLSLNIMQMKNAYVFLLESYGKSKNAYVFSLESMEKGRNAYVFSWYSFPTVQNTYILPLSPLFSPNQMIFSSMWFPFPACSNRSKQIDQVVPSPCTVCAQLVETNSLACAMFAVDCRQTTNFVFTVLAIEKKI